MPSGIFGIRLFLLVSLFTSLLSASGLNGRWRAYVTLPNGDTSVLTLDLKVDGDSLAGTIKGRNGESEISDGWVDGDELSFSVIESFHGDQSERRYKGTLDGDVIRFLVTEDDSHARHSKTLVFEARRWD